MIRSRTRDRAEQKTKGEIKEDRRRSFRRNKFNGGKDQREAKEGGEGPNEGHFEKGNRFTFENRRWMDGWIVDKGSHSMFRCV